MILDLSKPLLNEKSEVIMSEGKEFLVSEACQKALLAPDEKATGDEKFKAYKLFKKLEMPIEGKLNLSVEEISRIKEAVGKIYAPLIVGQVWDILEGEN